MGVGSGAMIVRNAWMTVSALVISAPPDANLCVVLLVNFAALLPIPLHY